MSASHNAEASVIGGCMLDPQAYWRIADTVTAEDFSHDGYRELFRVVADSAKAQTPVDVVTVGDRVPRLASLAMSAANTTPGSANIRTYAAMVAAHATHRRVVAAGQRIARLSPQDAFGEAQRILAEASRPELSAIRPAREVLADLVADLQRKCDADSPITGLSTGFNGLDDMTSGFQPGDLVILAGRPGMGKSTLAQNIGERVALRGKRVLFFSQEMSAANVLARSVAAIGGVPFGALRSPKTMDEAHWGRVFAAAEKLKAAPLLFDESCGITVEQLCARARQCHGASPLSLIVIDYLQYMRLPKADSTANAVQEVTRELKSLGKALGVPVLLLSQLNRGVEGRADKRPTLSDLRDSGAIEQDADIILFAYRDGYYSAESPHRGFAELIVAKQRNGRTGMIPLRERLDQMRFEDCDGLPHVEVARPARGFGRTRWAGDRRQASAGGE